MSIVIVAAKNKGRRGGRAQEKEKKEVKYLHRLFLSMTRL